MVYEPRRTHLEYDKQLGRTNDADLQILPGDESKCVIEGYVICHLCQVNDTVDRACYTHEADLKNNPTVKAAE